MNAEFGVLLHTHFRFAAVKFELPAAQDVQREEIPVAERGNPDGVLIAPFAFKDLHRTESGVFGDVAAFAGPIGVDENETNSVEAAEFGNFDAA